MLSLLVVSAHLVGDFVLQTGGMARRKFKSPLVRLKHVLTYSVPMALVAFYYWPADVAFYFVLSQALLHFLIDTQRWVKPKKNFEAYPIVVDQTLHLTSLALLLVVVHEFFSVPV